MIGVDTPFSPGWLMLAALLVLGVVVWTQLRLRRLLRPSYLWLLTGLRVTALLAILLLLLNPYSLRQEPDAEGFRVAVLADVSGSMEARDIRGGTMTRRELVASWLEDSDAPPFALLEERGYWVDRHRFAEGLAPLENGDLAILPGRTAIGDVLDETLERVEVRRDNLGAVILLSDGHSNAGTPPQEAARRFRDRGIPITAIGLGSRQPPGEVRADFTAARFRTERGQPVELPVNLANTSGSGAEVRLTLRDDNGVVEERDIQLASGDRDQRETFTVTPLNRGEHLYRLSITEPGANGGAREKIRYAFVNAEEPETFSVLYLGSRLSPEYRFIERGVGASEQIGMQSVIRTGEGSFFHALSEENQEAVPPDAFPEERAFFNRFDAILVDTRLLPELSEEGVAALADFVSVRGGGALFFGPLNGVPPVIGSALPVVSVEDRVMGERIRLELEPAPIFSHLEGGRLFGSPSLFLEAGLPAAIATEWKPGARPVLLREGRNEAIMAAQAFGAGRIAHLGSETTWQWRMASDGGMEQHRLFWQNLLVWLSSAGKPRLTVASQGEQYALGDAVPFEANVLGSDFRPSRDSTVTVRITDPQGETWERRLQPSFEVPGRYRTTHTVTVPGEYRAQYRIDFPDGERMDREVFFLATHAGVEGEDTRYRESVLRDLARVTGGAFYHYSEVSRFTDLPLSREIPVRDNRRYLADQGWLLLVFFAALAGEWFSRRRMGLK